MFGLATQGDMDDINTSVRNLQTCVGRLEAQVNRLTMERDLLVIACQAMLPADSARRQMTPDRFMLDMARNTHNEYLYEKGWTKGKADFYSHDRRQSLTEYLEGRCPECGK